MKNKFIELHSISEAHKYFGYDKPRHPLISVLDFTQIKPEVVASDASYQMSFYSISCKHYEGIFRYGKSHYDFNDGTLIFTAPHQVVSASHDSQMEDGWGLFFHPDLINGTSLGRKISEYLFFRACWEIESRANFVATKQQSNDQTVQQTDRPSMGCNFAFF